MRDLKGYLAECDVANAAYGHWAASPRNRLAARLCLALCRKYTRKVVRAAPCPDEDQALAAACNL